MSHVDPTGGPDGQEATESPTVPARSLEDALRELRGLTRQLNARKRAGRDARFLAQIEAQSQRRRAPQSEEPHQ